MSQQQEPLGPSSSAARRASESSPSTFSSSFSPASMSSPQKQQLFESTMEGESDVPDDPPPLSPSSGGLLWYRSHFSCQEIGRYFPSTKRRLTWIVGVFSDSHHRRCEEEEGELDAAPLSRETPGDANDEEQGIEHEQHRVELVWSVRSGKTRVLWDGNDITNLFSPASTKEQYERVLLSWDAPIAPQPQPPPCDSSTVPGTATAATSTSTNPAQPRRVRVQIEAHADYATDLRRRPQYDLTVDGKSYRSLPTRDELRELAFRRRAAQQLPRRRRIRGTTESTATTTTSTATGASDDDVAAAAAAAAAAASPSPSSAAPADKNTVEPTRRSPRVETTSRAMPTVDEGDVGLSPSPSEAGASAPNEEAPGAVDLPQHDDGRGAGAEEGRESEAEFAPGEDSAQDDNIVRHLAGDVDELSDLGYGVGDDNSDEDEGSDRVALVGAEEDEKEESYCVTPATSTDFDFRLSMVGLKPATSPDNSSTDVVDELRSDLYSPMLETLRLRITDHLPQLEDVVSKAIIHAFFVDHESSQHSCSGGSSSNLVPQQIHPDLRRSSSGSSTLASGGNNHNNNNHHSCRRSTTVQLEMDVIKAAHEFVVSLAQKVDGKDAESRSDVDDDDDENEDFLMGRRLDFMQAQIDAIFCLVRSDEIVPSQAARILLRVACVLGLDFARPIPTNTVLLTSLDEAATARDVAKALSRFGDVVVTAVAPGGYGLGRFRDAAAAHRVEADRESLVVKGQVPCVAVLTSFVANAGSDPPGTLPLDETGHSSDAEEDLRTDPPPTMPPRPASPQVTIPHLMALGEYNISFVAPSSGALSSSSSSLMATAPNKPRPISEATTSSGSSSTQATLAMTESSVSLQHPA